MDPVAALKLISGTIKTLYKVVQKVKENQEESLRLCAHTETLLALVKAEMRKRKVPDVIERLNGLASSLTGLIETVDELSTKPLLQRAIWRNHISTKIAECYRKIEQVLIMFQMGLSLDIANMLTENEAARQCDLEQAKQRYDTILQNDGDILKELQIHRRQMQEAVICIHRYFAHQQPAPSPPLDSERRVFEKGMQVMQRFSGSLHTIPDTFVITSLDIIVWYDNRRLGHGGFASVYEGNWKGVKVAVKVLDKDLPSSIVQREVDVCKSLRHPHILQFFGACATSEPPFLVCAFMENGDAVQYLQKNPEADRLTLLYEASLGLSYLHANEVVHGDLKASNILVNAVGKACLSDFGLSRIKLHTTSLGRQNTQPPSNVEGTARWMAPEHMTLGILNKKTDIYSFAMTMYEVFSGLPPFATTPEALLLSVVCDRNLRPLRPNATERGCADLTLTLWKVIDLNWAARPEDRQNALDIEQAMKAALDLRQLSQLPPGPDSAQATVIELESNLAENARREARGSARPMCTHLTIPNISASTSTSLTAIPSTSTYWMSTRAASSSASADCHSPFANVRLYVDSTEALQYIPDSRVAQAELKRKQTSAAWWKTLRRLKGDRKVASAARGMSEHYHGSVFGVSLQDSLLAAASPITTTNSQGKCVVWGYIPAVIAKCGLYLKANALKTPGIFQIPSSENVACELQTVFDTGPGFGKNFLIEHVDCSVHDAASLFFRYLAQLPEPVIPLSTYSKLLGVMTTKLVTISYQVTQFKPIFSSLPPANRYLLLYLLDLLAAFACHADTNMLDTHNIGSVFRHVLVSHPNHQSQHDEDMCHDIIDILITNQAWLMAELAPQSVL